MAWLLCVTSAAVGCHRRTPQELGAMIAAQDQQTWNNRPTLRSSVPTYTDCREATPADSANKTGPPFEAVCRYRRVDLVKIPPTGAECYPHVVVRTVGLWTAPVGLLSTARILNPNPVVEAEGINVDHSPWHLMAEAADARAKHTVQACPPY